MGSCLSSSEEPKRKERLIPSPLDIKQESDSDQLNHSSIEKEKLQSFVRCQLYDDPNPPECSYCGLPNSDKADMIICRSPTISYELFQKLMVRGWWRTGNVFFRPQNETICCPSFAIRLPVEEYQLSKAHKKNLNRWNEFLLNGDPRWEDRKHKTRQNIEDTGAVLGSTLVANSDCVVSDEILNTSTTPLNGVTHDHKGDSPPDDGKLTRAPKVVNKGVGPDPTKPLCKKAKERRAEKKQKRGNEQTANNGGNCNVTKKEEKKSLLEVIEEHEREIESAANAKHKLVVKLISNNDPKMMYSLSEFFDLYNCFQDAVHPGKSKFKTTADLQWGFIDSPLEHQRQKGSRPLGTYHMRYYLDGELIMISLLDILPEYLVSIYFIYDPDIRFLQPGIYTCLREIALVQKLQKLYPELKYYNLGFYNDFSPKINYKRQFKPTEILCPVTGTYLPLERVIPLLKKDKFCRFAGDGVPDRPEVVDSDLNDLIVLQYFSSASAQYVYYRQLLGTTKNGLKPVLRRYLQEVGDDVMSKMLISQ